MSSTARSIEPSARSASTTSLITSSQLSGSRTEERLHVAAGVLGVVGAHVVGDHLPLRPDGAQQRTRQRPGSGPGLQHPGAGEDVALVHDLRGVLRVDHLRAARHRQHVVDQQRPQHQELIAVGRLDHAALRLPDHRVVRDRAAVGVELAAGAEHHRVVPALGVGELHAITDDERTGSGHSGQACQQTRRRRCAGLSDPASRLRV